MARTRDHDTVFCERLEVVRHRLGETVDQFADRIGVSHRTIDTWRTLTYEPLLSYAVSAALATGYTIDELADPAIELPDGPSRVPQPVNGRLSLLPKGAVGRTEFGARARAALKAAGLPVKHAAEDIEVSRSTVQDALTGDREPRLTTALRLAKRLGVRLADLATPRAEEVAR